MKGLKKILKILGIIFGIVLITGIVGYFVLMSHTQIIVGVIQKISSEQVNTKNLYKSLGEPYRGLKNNGQFIITEINYSKEYPNSYLDITYPNKNIEEDRPTLFYFHGGGFFGGSKSFGDPLAERGKQMQHCFVANERTDEISKDAYDRMTEYIKKKVSN